MKRRLRLGSAALVFAVALALYAATLAPTVTLVDSGELIVAARTLGVAHPPGFPLYTLLAHLASVVPIGNVAARVNFASAFFAACAVAVLSLLAAAALPITGHSTPVPQRSATRRNRPPKPLARRETVTASEPPAFASTMAPAVVSGLLMACSRTLWGYATVAEVYTLNTLLIVLVFWLMLAWRRGMIDARERHGPRDALLYIAAFVFGLGLGVHHVTVGLTLPGLAALVYATEGVAFFRSRRLVIAALCALCGLGIYAYLPLAALRAPILNWGDPRTVQRLWWHVTGRQFQVYFALSTRQVGTELAEFATLMSREFGPWWLPLGLILAGLGLHTFFRRDRALFAFFMLVLGADVAYGVSYEIAEDKAAYYLPAFVMIAVAAGCGAQSLIHRAQQARGRFAAPLGVVAVLLAPVVACAGNLRYSDHHRYFIAQDYADNISSTIAPGGLLLTLDWQVCSPLLYVRTIEQRRRDVVLIDINLLRRSWYFDYLQREYPELIAQTREQLDAFLDDLRHWEQDPALYQRDLTLNQRIDARFNSLIAAFVSQHLRSAPVYVTQDVVLSRDAENSRLAESLTAAYQLVPQGLVFQLFADRAFHEPATPQLVTRGLADGTLAFEADDVVQLKVLPVYVSMLYNRGRYLNLYGRREAAIAVFEQALALDPTFAPAQRALAESRRLT
jgi:hypothetical protein